MKGLVGGPLLVGGLGPGHPCAPLKSGPASLVNGMLLTNSDVENVSFLPSQFRSQRT